MPNPTPHTLEQCNSREEILAFLATRRDDGITPIEWKSWIDLALARMEAIAAAPLREAPTIKSDNSQTLVNALAEIERLRGALEKFAYLMPMRLIQGGYWISQNDYEKVRLIAVAALASNPAPATEGV